MSVTKPDDAAAAPRSVLLLVVLSLVFLVAGVALAVYAALDLTAEEEPAAVPEGAAAAPVQITEEDLIRLFHDLSYNSPGWSEMSWMGVRTLQNPADMWVLQEIIHEIRPDFIIETGTFHGGSSLFFAMVLEELGGDGKVLTIDIEPRVKLAQRWKTFQKRVEVFTGSSTDPAIVKAIAERARGKKVLVTLDSDHRYPHVINELRAWAPLVSPGSYMVVQDTNLNGHPVLPDHGPGPFEAVQEFLGENPDFQIDKSRERFLLTYYPSGYLKRSGDPNQGEGG